LILEVLPALGYLTGIDLLFFEQRDKLAERPGMRGQALVDAEAGRAEAGEAVARRVGSLGLLVGVRQCSTSWRALEGRPEIRRLGQFDRIGPKVTTTLPN